MTLEIVTKRREAILDEVAGEYRGISRFARDLNALAMRMSARAFGLLKYKSQDAQKADVASLHLQIYDVKELRKECDRHIKMLERELEAFQSADSAEPTPTCSEYPLNLESFDEYKSKLAQDRSESRLESVA